MHSVFTRVASAYDAILSSSVRVPPRIARLSASVRNGALSTRSTVTVPFNVTSDRVGRPVTGSAPPRNRTCGFPAYGSSERVVFQPGVRRQLGIADPDSRPNQRVLSQEDFEVLPGQPALLAPL